MTHQPWYECTVYMYILLYVLSYITCMFQLMAELLVLKDNPQGAAKHMEDILMKQPGLIIHYNGWSHILML